MDVFDALTGCAYSPQIAAAAARLGRHGEALRSLAAQLDHASGACEWDGTGARAFRSRQAAATGQLRRAADLLDEAAGLLRHHAAAVADAAATGGWCRPR